MTEYEKEDFEAFAEELMFSSRGVVNPDDIIVELKDALADLQSTDPVEPVELTTGMFSVLAEVFGLPMHTEPIKVIEKIEKDSYYWTGVGTQSDLSDELESNGTRTVVPATYWQPSEPTNAWEDVLDSSFNFTLNGTEYYAATSPLGPDY